VLGDIVHAIRLYRPTSLSPASTVRNATGTAITRPRVDEHRSVQDRRRPEPLPEHLQEGLHPWQVKKLYLSVRESEPIATVKIDVGAYDRSLVSRTARSLVMG